MDIACTYLHSNWPTHVPWSSSLPLGAHMSVCAVCVWVGGYFRVGWWWGDISCITYHRLFDLPSFIFSAKKPDITGSLYTLTGSIFRPECGCPPLVCLCAKAKPEEGCVSVVVEGGGRYMSGWKRAKCTFPFFLSHPALAKVLDTGASTMCASWLGLFSLSVCYQYLH